MATTVSAFYAVYAAAVVTSVGVCLVLWQHRDRRGAPPLVAYILSGAVWGGLQVVNLSIDAYWLSVLLYKALYVNIALGVAALAVFALAYTGRERYLRPSTYLVLSVHPLYVVTAATVDPGSFSVFGELRHDPTRLTGVALDADVGLLLHMAYVYAVIGAAVVTFLELALRSHSRYRRQGVALCVGAVLPAIPPLGLLFGVVTIDLTPLAITIAGVIYTVAVVDYGLVDTVPVARTQVLDRLDEAVFVVDDEGRLLDVNRAGREMLAAIDEAEGSVVGRSFTAVFEETPLARTFQSVVAARREGVADVEIGSNHYEVTVTPADDDRGRHVGWLVIAHDVTERKRHEEQLEQQNERLDQFASLVSHDLRNPLNVADGYLDLAREGAAATDEYLARIEASHDRMETIIDDVLALTRQGAAVREPERVELRALAERAWDCVDTSQGTLRIESSTTIYADPDRAQRLLENLFRNSVEHGDPGSGPVVSVGVVAGGSRSSSDGRFDGDGPGVTLFVEDDGPGIPREEQDAVFEDGYSTTADGTGLGLSIVAQIADAHDWSVAATTGRTGGARFEFVGVERAAGSDHERLAPERAPEQDTRERGTDEQDASEGESLGGPTSSESTSLSR